MDANTTYMFFSRIRTRYVSEGSVQLHPQPYCFRRRVSKKKTPNRTNQRYEVQEQQQQQQRHPQQKQAAAAAAAAAVAAVENQVFGPTLIRADAKDRPLCFVLRQSPSMPRRKRSIRREEPSIAITADLRPFVTHTSLTVKTALFLFVIVTHSSSMKGPHLNFRAERELAGHLLAVSRYHKGFAPASDCLCLVLNRQARLPTLNSRDSTTNSSSTLKPTAPLQIDRSLYHTWKLCRQPGFTACSARESTTTERSGPMGRVHIYIHNYPSFLKTAQACL